MDCSSSPLVSLVVVNYNQGRFLSASLQSILRQTYRNLEILFWDDGSTDQSMDIAQSLAAQDDRLRVIRAPHQGLGLSRLQALEQTTGQYVGYVDADDSLAPNAIAETVRILEERPEIGWVYTDYQEIAATGHVLGLGHRCQIPYSPQGLLLDFMTFHFRLIRRSLYTQVQGQIEQDWRRDGTPLYSVDDYDLCLRLSELSPVYHLRKPLYYYRLHPQSLSHSKRSLQIQESAQIVEKALVRRGLNDRYQLSVDLESGVVALLPKLRYAQQLLNQIGAIAAAIPVAIALSLGSLFSLPETVDAQSITAAPDETGTQINEQGGQYNITGGTSAGQNLFHSFGDFGLNTGETANFISPSADIGNILGRITGGNPSFINGLIEVTGAGSPNLFLMNPAGMVFGSNASLNLPGSFTATTATGIGFEGGTFNAFGANSFNNLLLAPTHFSFATETGLIVNSGQLSVPYGNNLWLVGGSVLNLGSLSAPGGNITLAAIPEERSIRIRQEGMVLDLVLEATVADPAHLNSQINLFQAVDLPAALTSGNITQPDSLTVTADGRVFLGTRTTPFSTGDVGIGGSVRAQDIDLMAAGQVTPTDPSLVQGAGSAPTVVHFPGSLTDPLTYTFIDQRSDQATNLLYGGQPGTIATIVLKSKDGIAEVTQALQEFAATGHKLDGIQIVAEGNQGYFWLGNNIVDSERLASDQAQLQQWQTALGENANLLIYSCFTALGLEGEAFVNEFAASTGLNVAASVDATSSEEFGGNWTLEYQTGTINPSNPFTAETLGQWQGKLATITVINTSDAGAGSLRNAFSVAATGDTITFNPSLSGQTITLSTGELAWTKNLTVTGDLDSNGTPDITIHGNNATRILNVSSSGTLDGLRLQNGNLAGNGGALYTSGTGNITVTNSVITGNRAAKGGGVYNRGITSINNSTISGNTATNVGGGLWNRSGATLTVNNSTISGNTANGGAGIENYGTMTVTNSTISGNVATTDGGGIWNGTTASANLTISNSTIANNSAGTVGGGIRRFAGTVTLQNSIVANNTGGDVSGTITSLGQNIIKDGTAVGANILNVDPLLGALANNGGLTQTHALLTGSPAIDGSTTGTTTDQRGVTRPQGSNFDIGAFEVATNLIVDSLLDEDDNNLSVGNTSLREILTRTSLNTITFDNTALPTNGTAVINLSNTLGELLINRNFTLDATPLNGLTLDGGGNSRIFNINDGSIGTQSNVTLQRVTLRNGFTTGNGGAILNQENLNLSNSSILNSYAGTQGGGLWNNGTATIDNVTIEGNTGGQDGGGVFNTGTITIANSTISGNSATNSGGGIFSFGTLTIADSVISNNTSTTGSGIFHDPTPATTALQINSSSNTASFSNNDIESDSSGGITLTGPGLITLSGNVNFRAPNGSILASNITLNTNSNLGFYAGNSITFNPTTNINGSGTGTIALGTTIGPITINNSSINHTGTGAINLTANTTGTSLQNFTGISFSGASNISSNSGAITLSGVGGSGSNSAENHGVYLNASSSITSSAGSIAITGTAHPSSPGVLVSNNVGVLISGIVDTGSSGNITLTGFGGSSGPSFSYGDSNEGVKITGSGSVTLDNGQISITGTGGGGGSYGRNNRGINTGGTIQAQGSGSITLDGTGSGQFSDNDGVQNYGTIQTQGSGNITITGTGSTAKLGTSNDGIQTVGGTISATGTGTIELNGTRGSGSDNNRSLNLSGTISANNNITLTGNGSSNTAGIYNEGVRFDNGTLSSTAGTVTITGSAGTGSSKAFTRNSGVVIGQFATISSSSTTPNSGIDITGSGTTDPTATTDSHGVDIQGTVQATNTATVNITGSGGRGTDFNQGVNLSPSSNISAADGAITIEGTANADTTGANNRGISTQGTIASTGTTGTGTVSLTGTGGGGTNLNEGVVTFSGSGISSYGNIAIDGTGGSSATGNANRGVSLSGTIASNGTGTVSLTGTAGGGTDFNEGVATFSGSNITSVDGNITIDGTGSTSSSGQSNRGVSVAGTIASTGNAQISLTGTGGSGTNYNHGVATLSGSNISSVNGNIEVIGTGSSSSSGQYNTGITSVGTIASTGAATITLTGTGGAGTNNNHGVDIPNVFFSGDKISSVNGTITIEGTGSTSASGYGNRGINVDGTIESTGTAEISLTGTGGSGTDDNQAIRSSLNSYVTSASSKITISGTGSTSSTGQDNQGVLLTGTIAVAGSTGEIQITGTGGTGTVNNHGVELIDGDVITNGSNITITGTGTNNNQGVALSSYSSLDAQTGNVTITGNTDQLTTGVSITGASLTAQNLQVNGNTISIADGYGEGTVFPTIAGNVGTLSFQALSTSSPLAINFNSANASSSFSGFSQINLGRSGDTGSVNLLGNLVFSDPITIWSQNADFVLNTNLIGNDDASITIEGSGNTTTLNANIITNNTPITINDSVILGTSLVTLDTTNGGLYAGANVAITGTIDGTAQSLNVVAGAGDVSLGSVSGSTLTIGGLSIQGANTTLPSTVTIANGNLTVDSALTLSQNSLFSVLAPSTGTIDFKRTLNTSGFDLTLTADNIDFSNGAAGVISGGGNLTLQPFTPSRDIFLGGNPFGSPLFLSNIDLDALANGFSSITIGRSDGTGAMSFGSNITFLDPVFLQMPSGLGSINTSGGSQTAQEGIELLTGQTLTLGALTVNANNLRATSSQGRVVVNGTLNNTGTGEIILSGNNTGLVTSPGIGVNSNIVTNGGNITLTGATTEASPGVSIQAGILSNGGVVSVTGTSSQGTGLLVSSGGFVNAATGDIVLGGTSLGTGTLVHGVYLSGGSLFGNNITITGNSSGLVTSDGVLVSGGSTLSAQSDLRIVGEGTTGVKFLNAGSAQGTNLISLGGSSTTNTDDIIIDNSTLFAGTLNLTADQMHFLNSATLNGLLGTSTLNIAPVTPADNLTILFNNAPTPLVTSNFAQVTIGRTTGTGAISLRNDGIGVSNVAVSDPLVIQSPGTTGTIDTTGVNLQGNTMNLLAGNSITAGSLSGNALTINAGNSITTGNITSTAATNIQLTAPSVTVGSLLANPLTGNPTIALTGDEINFTSLASSGGLLTLQPLTPTQLINLGNADTGLAGTLDFTATDLNNLADGFAQITIGRSNSTGAVRLGTGFTVNDPMTIVGNNFTLQGSDTATTFSLSSNSTGSISGGNITLGSGAALNFSGVSSIQAGAGDDVFAFQPGFVVSLALNGGNGIDTLDYSSYTTDPNVNLATLAATNIESLVGSSTAAISTLTGQNLATTWSINGINTGIVGGINFTRFNRLIGGTANDTFTIAPSGSVISIDGGAGTGDIVQGSSFPNTWNITSTNGGSVGLGNAFTNIEQLAGGTDNDTFVFSDGITFAGTIAGNSGFDTLDYQAFTSALTVDLGTIAADFESIQTGSGNDTIIITPGAIVSVLGGDGDDLFQFQGGTPALIDGQGGNNTLENVNTSGVYTLTGANAGSVNGSTFNSLQNLITGNGDDTVTFLSGASLTGNFTGNSGILTIEGDEIEIGGVVSGSGDLFLRPITPSQGIVLGSIASTANLDLSSSELSNLAPGFTNITIGRSDGSGSLTLGSSVTFQDPVTLQMPSDTGTMDTTGGALTAAAGLTLLANGNVTTGNITVNGADVSITSQAGTVNVAQPLINTGSGAITILGNSAGSWGILTAGTGSITTNGGAINLSGTSTTLIEGIRLDSDITSNQGAVSLTGTAGGTGIWILNGASINTGGGSLTLTGINTASPRWGVLVDPSSGGLITNGGNVTIQGQTTVTGTISIGVQQNISAGTGTITLLGDRLITIGTTTTPTLLSGSTMTVQGNESLSVTNATLNSNGSPITLNSDRDGSGSGAIVLTGSTVQSQGGEIILGGGSDPLTGFAQSTATELDGIFLNSSILEANGGNITLRGTSNASSPESVGVQLSSSRIVTNTTGTLTLLGNGGGGDQGHGILFSTDSSLESENGLISLTGQGGTGLSQNYGIFLQGDGADTFIRSVNGEIHLTGTSLGTGSEATGIRLNYLEPNPVIVETTGTGNITLVGRGSTTGGDFSDGIVLNVGAQIRSNNGTIAVTGTAQNTGFGSEGIELANGSQIMSTGSGVVTLTGTGAPNSQGVWLQGGSGVRSRTASLSITGNTSGLGNGILLSGGSNINTDGQALSLTTTVPGGTIDTSGGFLSTSGAGASIPNGGTITIDADGNIVLGDLFTFGTSGTTGAGGDITVTSTQGTITGSLVNGISSNSDAGNAGAIQFTAGQGITLTGNVAMSADSISGNGGSILLDAQGGVLDASALGRITAQGLTGGTIVATSSDSALLRDLNTSASGGLSGNITVTAPNWVQIIGLTVNGSSPGTLVSLTGDELDFSAGFSATENASLNLLPFTAGQPITLGGSLDNSGVLDLTASDLASLGNGLTAITIGSSSTLSPMTVDGPITLSDPITFYFSDMTVNGAVQGIDNASLTFNGDGNTLTLNTDLTTQGQPIVINDRLVLGANALIATTASSASGADLQVNGTIDGTTPGSEQLSLDAGTGTLQLSGAIGNTVPLGGLFVTGSGLTLGNNITTINTTGTFGTIVDFNTPTSITAPITITAQQGRFVSNNALNLGSNNITFIVDGLRFLGGDSSVTGSGTLNLRPFTPNRSIALQGLAIDDSQVALSGATIAALADGFTQINLGDPVNGSSTFFIDTEPSTLLTLRDPFVLQGQSATSGGYLIRTGAGASTFTLTAQNAGFLTGDGLALVTNGSLSFLNATGIAAGLGTDTLVVNTGKDETIALANTTSTAIQGSVTGVNFAEIETLSAQSNSDTLLGSASAETITITGTNAGLISGGFSFFGVENITTGDGDDTLGLGSSGSVTGVLDGGVGNDRLDFSSQIGNITVDLSQIGAIGIETIVGNSSSGATSTLQGINSSLTWTLNPDATGQVFGSGLNFTFSGFNALLGGSAADQFTLSDAVNLAWTVDGGTGIDTLDYSLLTIPVAIDLQNGSATGLSGISNLENFVGGSTSQDILVALNTADTATLTGTNSGNLNNAVTFSNFETLDLGAGDDSFILSAGTLSGTIAGGTGNDSLTGDNVANTFTITGSNSGSATGITGGFTDIENLTGGTSNDSFILSAGTLSGTIAGGTGNDSLTGDNVANTFTITGANAGSATGITGGFSDIENLFGNAQNDTLVVNTGQDETIALADPISTPILGNVAGVSFAGIETLEAQGTSDQLLGTSGADTIVITGNNTGSSGVLTFSGIENIDTGDGDDTLSLLVTGSITGTLTGGTGTADRLDFSQQVGDLTVNLAQVGAVGVEVIIGNSTGSATDPVSTLRGTDAVGQTVNWTVTNSIDGTVLGAGLDFSFTGFNRVVGGSANDVFTLSPTVPLTIVLDGGDGVDQLDYSIFSTPIVVNLGTETASGIAGFRNMEGVLGSASSEDVLQGKDSGNTFTIVSPNQGSVDNTFNFASIENLQGGVGNDRFVLAGGVLTGNIDGQGGEDTLGADHVNNTFTITSANSGTATGVSGFSNLENLEGGTARDTVTLATGQDETLTLTGATTFNAAGLNFSNIDRVEAQGVNDLLQGSNDDDTVLINGVNEVLISDVLQSVGIENLDLRDGNDRLRITPNGSLSGLQTGDQGIDTLDLSFFSSPTVVDLNSFTLRGIERIVGNTDITGTPISTLKGFDRFGGSVTWTINPDFSGQVFDNVTGQNYSFVGFNQFIGGTADDRFSLGEGITLPGLLDGGVGVDLLDYSRFTSPIRVDLATSTATGLAGFQNLEGVIGGSSTGDSLRGLEADNRFVLTATNQGTVNETFSFEGIETLQGGPGNENIRFQPGLQLVGSLLTGDIDGGSGILTLEGDRIDFSGFVFGTGELNIYPLSSDRPLHLGENTGNSASLELSSTALSALQGFSSITIGLPLGNGPLTGVGDLRVSSPLILQSLGLGGTIDLSGATLTTPGTAVTLQADQSLQTGAITTNGGNLTLSSAQGSITSTGTLQTSGSEAGGVLSLVAPGAITTTDLNTSANNGGNLIVQSQTGITTGAITTQGLNGRGGDVLLDPPGDVQVTYIDARGTTQGGNVSITTGSLFRATGLIPGTLDSISTAGDLGGSGGSITIYHNGVSLGEFFVVGNGVDPLSAQGTLGGISSGDLRVPAGQYGQTFAITPTGQFTLPTGVDERPNINLIVDGSLNDSLTPPTVFVPEAGCPPDCLPDNRIELDLPVLTLPTINSVAELSVEEVETEFTNEVAEHNGVDRPQPRSLPQIQGDLQAIEDATGIKPAIIYVLFTPTTVNSEGSNENNGGDQSAPEALEKVIAKTNNQQSLREPQVLWEFSDSASPLNLAQMESFTESDREVQGSDELEIVLVTSQGNPIRVRVAGANRSRVLQAAALLRQEVSDPGRTSSKRYLQPARLLYNWIIRPIETALKENEIDNLVFVMDSGLRSLPVAALNDGEQFLIEHYSAGMMPSLTLTDTRYRDIRQVRLLGMGASSFENQSDLPTVPLELKTIAGEIWKNSEYYLNEDFTADNLRNRSEQFGIIHLATHADFLPGDVNNSYIALSRERISIDRLRDFGWQGTDPETDPPVELLTLSACKTAIGSDEAELGFAGLAVQAGVKTALASLWYVSDAATTGLMTKFYELLADSQSAPIKAEALRQAQLAFAQGQISVEGTALRGVSGVRGSALDLPADSVELLNDRELSHPYYWASFTLVGSPW